MAKIKPYEKQKRDKPDWITEVGSFKNEYGEKFVVYQMGNLPGYFVTGDELDWEMGYRFDERCGTLVYDFLLNEQERQNIVAIIEVVKVKFGNMVRFPEVLPNVKTVLQEKGEQMTKELLRKAFLDLSQKEQEVLAMRFGLKDGITHNLEEVSKLFGVTRERIRQIETKALEKINHAVQTMQ